MSVALAPSRLTALRCIEERVHLDGEVWECGVFKGNTARLLKDAVGDSRVLRLFDTFAGCPQATSEDLGPESRVRWPWATSLDSVKQNVSGANVHYHQGIIPDSMVGLESARIVFVYLDLTLYAGTKGALSFILPRMVEGGCIFIRDYYGSIVKWPGLVRAVDEFNLPLQRHDYDAVVPC